MPIINANNVYADQTPRSVAPDLGLHCLPVSLLWDARLKLVKTHVIRYCKIVYARSGRNTF